MKLIDKITVASAAALVMGGISFADDAMADNVRIGDYIKMGKYNDIPIVWRVVDIDENGPLLMSDKILCMKEFDAAGTGGTHDNSDHRVTGGSPVWSESNLRSWLMSEADTGNVEWLCGNEPSYKDEKGFLNDDNFSVIEKRLMKEVTQKNLVGKIDTDIEGFVAGSDFTPAKGNAWEDDLTSNYGSCAYQLVADKMFIPDVAQAERIKNNLGAEYLIGTYDNKYQLTWLRQTAGTYYAWAAILWNSLSPGESYGAVWRTDAKTNCAVRPSFYLNEQLAVFTDGTGGEDDPYVVSDMICTITIDGVTADTDGGLIAFPSGSHELKINYLSQNKDSVLFAALYDDDKLVKVMSTKTQTTEESDVYMYGLTGDIEIPEIHNGYEMRIFEWNMSDGKLNPMAEASSRRERIYRLENMDDRTYRDGDIVGFIGDEITNNGEYVKNIQSFYALRYPDRKVTVTNLGRDGADTDTVLNSIDDVTACKITKANIMLGMNDVGVENYYKNNMSETEEIRAASIDKYINNMDAIVQRLKESGINDINIMTPSLFDQTRKSNAESDNPIIANDGLEIMGERLKTVAGASLYEMNSHMKVINDIYSTNDQNATIIGDDLRTPGSVGNMVMTYLYLKQQGFSGCVSEVTVDAGSGEVTAENCDTGDKEVYDNYASFSYKPYSLPLPVTSAYMEADRYVPITDELNREIIKVTNLSGGLYSLSIDGKELGRYREDELSKGVNISSNANNPNANTALEADKLSESGNIDGLYSFIEDSLEKTHNVVIRCVKSDEENSVSLHGLFCDDMVLQRGKVHTVWGKAAPGSDISVEIYNTENTSTANVKADDSGDWKVDLEPLPSGGPYTMKVISDNKCLVTDNVFVGDVFVLAGQSNMERSYNMAINKDGLNKENLRPAIENDKIKYLKITNVSASQPTYDIRTDTDGWDSLDSTNNKDISLIGMYFAEKRLEEEPDVPIGILSTAWGGTPISRWVKGGNIFNNHISPIADYNISAVLWYQGESDSGPGVDPDNYRQAFVGLINDYRALWGEDDLPFFYVQLTRYDSTGFDYTTTRQVQLEALKLAENTDNLGMVVTLDTDKGSQKNIHPYGKEVIAERLDLIYKNKVLGDSDVVYTGPLFKSAVYTDGKVIVEFEDYSVGTGLKIKDVYGNSSGNMLNEFEIAGEDGVFVPATAVIMDDDKIAVTGVENPKYVRYAYKKSPSNPNLFNNEDLPASPFTAEVLK